SSLWIFFLLLQFHFTMRPREFHGKFSLFRGCAPCNPDRLDYNDNQTNVLRRTLSFANGGDGLLRRKFQK
ncbi:MAG: hypothetical protein LUD80_05355, partial [Clostridiales bacterium]|nr:hypothetical protein [Clostridiales bacterium]